MPNKAIATGVQPPVAIKTKAHSNGNHSPDHITSETDSQAEMFCANEVATALVRRLHRGGTLEFFQSFALDGKKESYWRKAEGTIELPAHAAAGAALFFAVHPVTAAVIERDREEYPHKTDAEIARIVGPKNSTIELINALYSEWDGKDFTKPTEAYIDAIYAQLRNNPAKAKVKDKALRNEAIGAAKSAIYQENPAHYKAMALAHIESLTVAQSVTIDSGGGYQGYLFLSETFHLRTDADRARAASLQTRWVAFTGGDPQVHDLRRVLRLPGTYNRKKKYAPDYPLVSPHKADFDHCLTLDEIEAMLPTIEVMAPKVIARERSYSFATTNSQSNSVINRFNEQNNIADVLEAQGYTRAGHNRMSRPGEPDSAGVIIDTATNRSQHWSSNDELYSEYRLRPFNVVCTLDYNDDVKEAVKAIAKAERMERAIKSMPASPNGYTSAPVEDNLNPFTEEPNAQAPEVASIPTVEPVTLAILLAEIQTVADKHELQAWAIASAPRCIVLGLADVATLKNELAKRKVSKTFLEREWPALLKDARSAAAGPAVSEKPQQGPRYLIDNGAIYEAVETQAGPDYAQLCNFSATITANVSRDDGEESTLNLAINGRLQNGRELPEITIKADEFENMRWPVEQWGAEAAIEPGKGVRDKVRHAIQWTSERDGIGHRRIYTHTGWRIINGERVFLHAGGAMGGDLASVDLPGNLKYYSLPTDEAISERDAMIESIKLLDIAPPQVTYPIFASMYTAPLSEIIEPAYLINIEGQTGSLKTSLTTLYLNHFGAKFNEHRTPSDWMSTAGSLEKMAFLAKDLPFLIDDFRPSSNRIENQKMQDALGRIARAVGNRAGRGRLDGGTEFHRTYIPRGLVISTAERGAVGMSVNARMLTITVEPGDIDREKLAQAQAQRHVYGYAMAGYLRSIAQDWDELSATLPGQLVKLRAEGNNSHHLRLSEATANLYLGFNLAMNYAISIDAITKAEAARRCTEYREVLKGIAEHQSAQVKRHEPALQYIQTLITLIAQGKASITGKGALPNMGGEEKIGWHDGETIYLLPAAFNLVCQYVAKEGASFPSDEATLKSELRRQGYITKVEKARNTTLQRDPATGYRERVIGVSLEKFLQVAEDTGLDSQDLYVTAASKGAA